MRAIKSSRGTYRMTCIVAAKASGKTIIGADSCTTLGDRKLVKMVNGSKLVAFEHFIVGLSGTGPLREILDVMVHEPICETTDDEPDCYDWRRHELNSTVDVAKFLQKFMELYQEKGDAESMDTVELLLITKDRIFCTVGESGVFEVGDFWSVGSGSAYAMGVMEALYGKMDAAEKVVGWAIECACKYAAGCEPPVELMQL